MHEDLSDGVDADHRDLGGRQGAELRASRMRLAGAALLGLGMAAYWYGRSLGAW